MTTATERDWKPSIQTQLDQLGDLEELDATHAVIWLPEDDTAEPQLLDVRESEQSAIVSAEDRATRVTGGEIRVITIADLLADASEAELEHREDDPAAGEVELDEAAHAEAGATQTPRAAEGTTRGEDADKGKLFDVKVTVDPTQPTALNVAFSGGIPISVTDEDAAKWVEVYNNLKPGKSREITVTVHVAGTKKTHRRDKDGDVDAVVETKSLIVTDIHLVDSTT